MGTTIASINKLAIIWLSPLRFRKIFSLFFKKWKLITDITNEGNQEDLVFEHVRFDPVTNNIDVTIKNTGSVETIIDRVILVNMTSQNVLFSISGISTFDTNPIQIKDSRSISIPATIEDPWCVVWDCGSTTNWDYKISIITGRGNFFDTVARPFNT